MQLINYISDSFKGSTHHNNQDGIIVILEDQYKIFTVFDGVSLSENQIKGVQVATEFISENYWKFYKEEDFHLKEMMKQANKAIMSSLWKDALTTYCAAVLDYNRNSYISHLGDSRIYILDRGNLEQHTVDDVVFPGSNILTKCLGVNRLDDSDFYERKIKVEKGRLLLCTDGFYEWLNKESKEFLEILCQQDLENVKKRINVTIAGKNRDDATYILVDLGK
jgi:serine/threonine protein phosphatase PrpC